MSHHPLIAQLPAGEHLVCGCGESSRMPLCDGKQGSLCRRAAPLTLETPRTLSICRCGRTSKAPLCDGSHGYEKPRQKSHR